MTSVPRGASGRAPRRMVRLTVLAVGAALLFALFVALGTWQVQRLAWKHDLIDRVQARTTAAPVPAPGPAEWPDIQRASHEYLRVRLQGQFLHDKEALVQASTALGGGFWALTPLQQADGSLVIVNRGFLPPQAVGADQRRLPPPAGPVQVHGLLRLSEPGGGFLRRNDPAGDRWFSRDVQGIARARGLPEGRVAPYFVDASATPGQPAGTWPVGGLTVLRFPDNHLVYALTWYALALMVLMAAIYVWRHEPRHLGDDDEDEQP